MWNYVVLREADAPNDPVIKVEGLRFYRVGPTELDDTHDAIDIEDTAPDCDYGLPVPGNCPNCGLAEYYRITNLAQLNASGCSACETQSGQSWNGKLGPGPDGTCGWLLYTADSGQALSGKRLHLSASWLRLASGVWELLIKCYPANEEAPAPVIWFGTKSTGRTPGGEYTRHATGGGCASGPGTLMVEAVPI